MGLIIDLDTKENMEKITKKLGKNDYRTGLIYLQKSLDCTLTSFGFEHKKVCRDNYIISQYAMLRCNTNYRNFKRQRREQLERLPI